MRYRVVKILFVPAALVVLAAVSVSPLAQPVISTVVVSGYALDDTPAIVARFASDKLVVVGEVQSRGDARLVNADSPMPLVYTPVKVAVSDVIAGAATVGDVIDVRGLGGTVGTTSYNVEDMPSIGDLGLGKRVLLVLGDARDVGDGLVARTPDFVYSVSDSGVARGLESGRQIDLASFRDLFKAARGAS